MWQDGPVAGTVEEEEEVVELPENTLEEDQALAGEEVDKELLAKKRELLLDSLMTSQGGGSFERYQTVVLGNLNATFRIFADEFPEG